MVAVVAAGGGGKGGLWMIVVLIFILEVGKNLVDGNDNDYRDSRDTCW